MFLFDVDYYVKVYVLFVCIEVQIDVWFEDDVVDIDIYCMGGLFEFSMLGGSKIVINIQLLFQEIWLVVCLGGYYFKWDGLCWVDCEGEEFCVWLLCSVSEQVGQVLSFSV